MPDFIARRSLLQSHLKPSELLLLSRPTDLQYYSGFQTLLPTGREAFLLLSAKHARLIYSSFSPITSVDSKLERTTGTTPNQLTEHLHSFMAYFPKKNGARESCALLVDPDHLTVREYEAAQAAIPNCILFDTSKISHQRSVKDTEEMRLLIKAGEIAARAWEELAPQIKIGQTELEVELLLENILRQHGSEEPAFPSIVAFGENSALPHHQPGETVLHDDMAVLIDFGATSGGYRSDMTRSFWFGSHPETEYTTISDTVMTAYQAAFDVARTGSTAGSIDTAAREIIRAAHYGAQFIHTTGHSLGLDIHELPSINGSNTTPLQTNMVITIEPGIYLEGKYGVRYENTVIITGVEPRELTRSITR